MYYRNISYPIRSNNPEVNPFYSIEFVHGKVIIFSFGSVLLSGNQATFTGVLKS
jgi:hypothetical protein